MNDGTEKEGLLICAVKEGMHSRGGASGPRDVLVAGRDEGPGSAVTVSLRTGSAVTVSLRTALILPLNLEPLIFRLFGSNLVVFTAISGITDILSVYSSSSNGFSSKVLSGFSVKISSRMLLILPLRTFFNLFPGTFFLIPLGIFFIIRPGTFFMLPRMLHNVPWGSILFRRTWILDSSGEDTLKVSPIVSACVGSVIDNVVFNFILLKIV